MLDQEWGFKRPKETSFAIWYKNQIFYEICKNLSMKGSKQWELHKLHIRTCLKISPYIYNNSLKKYVIICKIILQS